MDFRDSPEEAAFRQEVRAFVAREYKGDEGEAQSAYQAAAQGGAAAMQAYKGWMTKLATKGWVAPAWPKEYGGAGMTIMEQFIFNEELAQARVPRPGGIGITMAGPTIIVYGSDDQKKQHLSGMLTGGKIWCQGFSETGSGSDLASLQTRAVRDGDDYIVNGQKIWTTGAQYADRMILLARTDPEAPKHKGISYFLLDMKAPGVSVRPLVNMAGTSGFNEVFFDNVRIPDSMRVGPEGEGWRVAVTTLMNERVALSGAGSLAGDAVGGSPIASLIKRHQPVTDSLLRQRVVQLYIEGRLIRLNNQRAGDRRKRGAEAGPEGSITKLMQAEFNQRLQKLAVDMEGVGGVAWEPTGAAKPEGPLAYLGGMGEDRPAIARGFLRAQANTIEGGTSNVMRNILGERVLGLPKEPDSSRDLAWKDVPRSG